METTIALSIVFLGVEIAHARHGLPGITSTYAWLVAFAFGLLHRPGFAGAFSAIGLRPSKIPLALFIFNIGVELRRLIFVFTVLTVAVLLRYGIGLTRDSAKVPEG